MARLLKRNIVIVNDVEEGENTKTVVGCDLHGQNAGTIITALPSLWLGHLTE